MKRYSKLLKNLLVRNASQFQSCVTAVCTIQVLERSAAYNRYVEFKSIIRCQIVHLVDRSDLFNP